MIAPTPPSSTNKMPVNEPRGHMRAHNRLLSFHYAFAGLWYLLRTQRNAQIHCASGAIAVVCGLVFHIERGEWIALVLTSTLVLAAEGVNTALEAVVDLASPGYNELAKIAKDVAAGTVLITAIGAIIVGLIIFLPRLLVVLWWLVQ